MIEYILRDILDIQYFLFIIRLTKNYDSTDMWLYWICGNYVPIAICVSLKYMKLIQSKFIEENLI